MKGKVAAGISKDSEPKEFEGSINKSPVTSSSNRERSLSPLAQKLAMQNNAWAPPEYIKPTKSFIDAQVKDEEKTKLSVGGKTEASSIAPFAIGANKSASALAAIAAATAPDGIIRDIPELLTHDNVQASSSSVVSTVSSAVLTTAPVTTTAVVAATATVAASAVAVTTANGSSNSQVDIANTEDVKTSTSSSLPTEDLDRRFEECMKTWPKTVEEANTLSKSLIVLSQR